MVTREYEYNIKDIYIQKKEILWKMIEKAFFSISPISRYHCNILFSKT